MEIFSTFGKSQILAWKCRITHFGKKALFPKRDFFEKPNKNHTKTIFFSIWKMVNFSSERNSPHTVQGWYEVFCFAGF